MKLTVVDPAKSAWTYVAWWLGLYAVFAVSWRPTLGLAVMIAWLPVVWVVNYRRGRAVNKTSAAALASCGATAQGVIIHGVILLGGIKEHWITNVVGVSLVLSFGAWMLASVVLATGKGIFQLQVPSAWTGTNEGPRQEAPKPNLDAQLATARRELEQARERLPR